jgi:hypothetical protein
VDDAPETLPAWDIRLGCRTAEKSSYASNGSTIYYRERIVNASIAKTK